MQRLRDLINRYSDATAMDPNTTVIRGPGKILHDDSGYQHAFAPDSDQRGYVQETRIPWKMLSRTARPVAGLKFGCVSKYSWGGPSDTRWPAVMWSDPVTLRIPVPADTGNNSGYAGCV